ncbi:hypothetical protein YC2023_094698 [Brassica napus]
MGKEKKKVQFRLRVNYMYTLGQNVGVQRELLQLEKYALPIYTARAFFRLIKTDRAELDRLKGNKKDILYIRRLKTHTVLADLRDHYHPNENLCSLWHHKNYFLVQARIHLTRSRNTRPEQPGKTLKQQHPNHTPYEKIRGKLLGIINSGSHHSCFRVGCHPLIPA